MDKKANYSLKKWNPWHFLDEKSDEIQNRIKNLVPREGLLSEAIQRLDTRFVLTLQGPRRTGKSELMYLIMDHLIKALNIHPKQIIFAHAEDATLREPSLVENIKAYAEELWETPFEKINQPLFFFVDEITSLPQWELALKLEIDRAYQHQWTVTSSSTIALHKSQATLVGRHSLLKVFPFSFYESIRLQKKSERFQNMEPDDFDMFLSVEEQLEGILKQEEFFNSPHNTLMRLNQFHQGLQKHPQKIIERLQSLFHYYLLEGGYPAFITAQTQPNYFSEAVLKRVIYGDIPPIFNLRMASLAKLDQLLQRLLFENTRILNQKNLQNEINEKNQPRLSEYLFYLSASQLLECLIPYDKKSHPAKKMAKKVYFIDAGLVHETTGVLQRLLRQSSWESSELWQQSKGVAAETMVYQHLKRLDLGPLFYYRDDHEHKDIDFIWQTPYGPIPVECKMRGRTLDAETTDRILQVIQEIKAPFAVVTTANEIGIRAKKILLIPTYYFLGMSHA